MNANFSIVIELTSNLVRVKMGGFYSDVDVEAFTAELICKMRALQCAANQHSMLCDVSEMNIQSQEVVGMFAKVVGHPKFRSKFLAFVTGSTLARMQAHRLTIREGVKFFSEVGEAEQWLLVSTDGQMSQPKVAPEHRVGEQARVRRAAA